MKKYRMLLPIVMVVIMVLSWYILISDAQKTEGQYQEYLTLARGYAEDGITKYALENYRLAQAIKNTPELYKEVADYYMQQDDTNSYYSWCEEFLSEFPKEPMAYDCMLVAYKNDKDYEACYDLFAMAAKRKVTSDYIVQSMEEMKYYYALGYGSYDEVGVYSNNYCAVNNKGYWGFVDRYGNMRIGTTYVAVEPFTQSGMAPVINENGSVYFIDKTGAKVKVCKETYASFGLLVDNVIAAKKTNGRYVFLNDKFEVLFGDYEYASTMNAGIAAVKNGNKWHIIDGDGQQVGTQKYVDVILDEKSIAYRNDRMFVSLTEGKYIMVDGSCGRIGTLEFEDAIPFMGEQNAAVKINGKWRFVNKDGALVSNKTYDAAKSYSNGLAAVCIDGEWGFVDESETLVIEAAFDDAKYFTEKGSCFVKVNDNWQLLKIYRLNREDS